jgi:hypothetical protein
MECTEEQEATVMEYLRQGKNPGQVAKLIGKDRGFVIRVAKRCATELDIDIQEYLRTEAETLNSKTGKALTAWSKYNESGERQALLSKTLSKMETMLDGCEDTRQLRDLCVCVGILVDKFQVEQGRGDDKAKSALVEMFNKMAEENREP